MTGYLPAAEQAGAIVKTRRPDGRTDLRQGDELLVQVDKEAIKQKPPRLTANLSFPGKYLVLTTGRRTHTRSRVLGSEDKKRLKKTVAPVMDGKEYGIVVRTNAAEASETDLLTEWELLRKRLEKVVRQGVSRTCCSCLLQDPGPWIDALRQYSFGDLTGVVTDHPDVYREISAYLEEADAQGRVSLTFYEDEMLPLYKLYRLSTLENSLKQSHVWLKSGGYLVIEQTEAFVAVDVNTGRYSGKKDSGEVFRRINREAAAEIAVQLRLRQLSGTILIDFINMERADDRKELLQYLKECVRDDPVKTKVVDMTPLQITELTRTKERKSFAEQLKAIRAIADADV